MPKINFDRRPDESDNAYIVRLRVLARNGAAYRDYYKAVAVKLADCPEDVCHACIGRELKCDKYTSPDGDCQSRRFMLAAKAVERGE